MVEGIDLLFVTSIVEAVAVSPDRSSAISAHDRCPANTGAALISVTTSAVVVRANDWNAMVIRLPLRDALTRNADRQARNGCNNGICLVDLFDAASLKLFRSQDGAGQPEE